MHHSQLLPNIRLSICNTFLQYPHNETDVWWFWGIPCYNGNQLKLARHWYLVVKSIFFQSNFHGTRWVSMPILQYNDKDVITMPYFDGLVKDCSNSSAFLLLQSCTNPSICHPCMFHSALKYPKLTDNSDFVDFRKFANVDAIYLEVYFRRIKLVLCFRQPIRSFYFQ